MQVQKHFWQVAPKNGWIFRMVLVAFSQQKITGRHFSDQRYWKHSWFTGSCPSWLSEPVNPTSDSN